jgi:hypothetical protein
VVAPVCAPVRVSSHSLALFSGSKILKRTDGMATAPSSSAIRRALLLHFIASIIAFFVGFHDAMGIHIGNGQAGLLQGVAQILVGIMALGMPILVAVWLVRARASFMDFLFYLAITLFMSLYQLFALARLVS